MILSEKTISILERLVNPLLVFTFLSVVLEVIFPGAISRILPLVPFFGILFVAVAFLCVVTAPPERRTFRATRFFLYAIFLVLLLALARGLGTPPRFLLLLVFATLLAFRLLARGTAAGFI